MRSLQDAIGVLNIGAPNRNGVLISREMWKRSGILGLAGGLLLVCAAGCGDAGPELIPVVGTVRIDGQPATEGAVTYRHESSGAFEASGLILPDGTYKLMQKDREGAQVGQYRVVVFVRKTPRTSTGEMAGLPAIIVNQRFTNPNTTPLRIEVKKDAPAGHYDLAVTR